VAETLESLGAGRGTMLGTTARTMATLHGATADAIEGVQRTIMAGLERARRGG
jgi:hypothetical protein